MLRAITTSIDFLERLDRGAYLVAFAAVLLIGAAASPWYAPPSAHLSSIDTDGHLVVRQGVLLEALLMRVALAAFALACLWSLLRVGRVVAPLRVLLWLLVAGTLAIPFSVSLWNPDTKRDSELLFHYVDQSIQDMEFNLVHQQRDWRAWQRFDHRVRGRGSALEPLLGDQLGLRALSLPRQTYFIEEVLGLSVAFFNLAARAWYLALLGVLTMLIGIYTTTGGNLERLRRECVGGLAILLIALAGLLVPRALADIELQRADTAIAIDDLAAAERHLVAAAIWKPILATSLVYQVRLGHVQTLRGCEQCPAALAGSAGTLFFERNYAESVAILRLLELHHPEYPWTRYWQTMAMTESAIFLFNVGQTTAARDLFREAVQRVPINAFGWYGLSMAYLRLGDFHDAARAMGEVVRLQDHIAFKRLTAHGQWLLLQSWAHYRDGDFDRAHHFYSTYLNPGRWR